MASAESGLTPADNTDIMIQFVNAKINIGLQIVARREDGYHDLETVFYPIGVNAGTPSDPYPFCDILEVVEGILPDEKIPPEGLAILERYGNVSIRYVFTGLPIDCRPGDNLVCRAAKDVVETSGQYEKKDFTVLLDKHIHFGAGIGGGSADAMFLVKALNETGSFGLSDSDCFEISKKLGSDTTFFLLNRPCFMEGKGENLEEISIPALKGCSLVLCNPDIYVSTKEAFSRVVPHKSEFNLRKLPELPLEEWKYKVHNDFEDSIFPSHPFLSELKSTLYGSGAIYSGMSGSGSSVFGIFRERGLAENCYREFKRASTLRGVSLLSL